MRKRALFAVVLAVFFAHASTYAQTTDIFEIAKTGTSDDMQFAVNGGLEVNAQDEKDEYQRTPLMWAATNNPSPEVVTVLVGAGADVNARAKDGRTPLIWAAGMNRNPKVLTALLSCGADVIDNYINNATYYGVPGRGRHHETKGFRRRSGRPSKESNQAAEQTTVAS